MKKGIKKEGQRPLFYFYFDNDVIHSQWLDTSI